MERRAKFLWMKDVLDHLTRSFQAWELADGRDERLLADTVRRDLDEIRRICESLHVEARGRGLRELVA
ncbi:MAG: hypothetical protein K1X74_06735 [Pirellulales bacterium]|nr:hypothetical protein [Pirellulales bacterium]